MGLVVQIAPEKHYVIAIHDSDEEDDFCAPKPLCQLFVCFGTIVGLIAIAHYVKH